MTKQNRDEFTKETKLQIAKRAGWLCSDPSCRRSTIGSNSEGDGEINLGTPAHICAAAPGGPRYDPNQTAAQRGSSDNGIWLCRNHGTAVDAKDSTFTVELLRAWKTQAQKDSWRRVLHDDVPHGPAVLSGGFSLEDASLVEIALSDTRQRDDRAQAAASVLGPLAVGRMIETVLEAKKHLRDASGNYAQAAGDRYHDLQVRIARTPGASLIAAVLARSARAGNEEMADLAQLISRHPNGEDYRGRPFDAAALASIRALAEDWGNRMLASGDATREQLEAIARLASRAPALSLLGLLKRLLDENLSRYRALRDEAKAAGWRQGKALDEARTPRTHEYQRAFHAINAPETAALMREYLQDEHFGQLAAVVLGAQWTAGNEPSVGDHFRGGVDFSRVEERRAVRARDPAATSAEAEAIFSAIDPLIANEASEDQKKHAIALGIVVARLPHGKRDATIQS